MEESITENPVYLDSGSDTKSRLRYPLRSAFKSKEEKPPVPEFSNASASRRRRPASIVSQSTSVLNLSAKDGKSAKPPRRLSIPTKSTINSASKSLSNSTPISETRAKRSNNANSKSDTPVSGVPRSTNRRKINDLSSASYWLPQIKLSESVSKHSISFGFFKLALESGCEPLQRMRDELKSYAQRNNLGELTDAVKELYQIYDISKNSEQFQISETQKPEEGTMSLDDEVQSSSSMAMSATNMNVTPEALNNDASQISTAKMESVSKNIQPARTRRSLNINLINSRAIQESSVSTPEDNKVTPKGFSTVAAQVSTVKQTAKKEVGSKNNPPARTRRSLNNSSANSRTISEPEGYKSERKVGKITRPEANEEKQKTKKHGKKCTGKEGPVNPSLASETVAENKENLDAPPVEEIGLAEASSVPNR